MESVKWSAIRKVAQTGKYFFLYVDKHSAMIVAKADIKEDGSEKIASYWKAEQARRQERKNATKVIEGEEMDWTCIRLVTEPKNIELLSELFGVRGDL